MTEVLILYILGISLHNIMLSAELSWGVFSRTNGMTIFATSIELLTLELVGLSVEKVACLNGMMIVFLRIVTMQRYSLIISN